METQVIIVDKDNNIIGHKSRSELTSEDIYRVSAVRITDENGKILLGQRALTKKKNPWKRWSSVAWTLELGETYESNIIKEIEEEIGIKMTLDQLQAQPIEYREWSWWKNKYFGQWFVWIYDWEKSLLKKQDEEVEALKRFTKEELQQELENTPEKFLTSVSIKLEEFNTL